MSLTLHQYRCFLAAMERGSFSKAAEDLHLSQPSLSDQIRLFERSLGVQLFQRLGRGVAATESAIALRPHALTALTAVETGRRAVTAVSHAESGTVRFGLFGAAHLYIAGDVVAATIADHPQLRIVLFGQNSRDVIADIHHGRLEAGLVALPVPDDDQLEVTPVARDEVVYLSSDPSRARRPITPARLADARIVLSDSTWGERDLTRQQLIGAVQSAHRSLRPDIEVENVETALNLAARGYADTIAARGMLTTLSSQLPQPLFAASLRPRIHDHFAIVHRRATILSQATQALIGHATRLLREVTDL